VSQKSTFWAPSLFKKQIKNSLQNVTNCFNTISIYALWFSLTSLWRRRRDSNPRAPFDASRFSRPTPSARLGYSSVSTPFNIAFYISEVNSFFNFFTGRESALSPSPLLNNLFISHIRTQHFRNNNCPIFLLVVF
jgi:hypothetical protein